MTSMVTVVAHCAKEKEVIVTIVGSYFEPTIKRLQDTETEIFYVYDDKTITVQEVVKCK